MDADEYIQTCRKLHAFCAKPEEKITRYVVNPFMDYLDHPDIARIVHSVRGTSASLPIVPTDTYRIAKDKNWKKLIDDLKAAGTREIHTTLYGLQDTHDWFARRKGAFEDLASGVGRLTEQGLSVKLRILLHKKNLAEIERLRQWVDHVTGRQAIIDYFIFAMEGSGKKNQHLRLEEPDLRLLPEDVQSALRVRYKTERDWLDEVRTGKWSFEAQQGRRVLAIDIFPNLDVRGGVSSHGVDDLLLGNLRTENFADIFAAYREHLLPSIIEQEERDKKFLQEITSITSKFGVPADNRLYSKQETVEKWERP